MLIIAAGVENYQKLLWNQKMIVPADIPSC